MTPKRPRKEADVELLSELEQLRNKCFRLEQEAIEHDLTEEYLHRNEGKFRNLLDEISDPIFTIFSDGRYGYVNLAFAEAVAKRQDQIIGRKIHDIFSKEEADKRFAVVRSALKQRERKVIEVCVPGPEGPRYYITTAKPILADSEPGYVLCISKEITERKRTEALLRDSEERLELALANSGLWPWDLDVRKGVMTANSRWVAMLGYDPSEISIDFAYLQQLIHPDDFPGMKTAMKAHVDGETPAFDLEYRLRHQDGHWVWFLARGKIVSRDEQGKPLRVIGTNQDISNQRRLNIEGADLLRRIESLIRAVGERPGMGTGDQAPSPGMPQLSKRQRQVLELVAAGCTSAAIARQLSISPATAITHRRDLMRKLELHSIAELTRYAIEHNLVSR